MGAVFVDMTTSLDGFVAGPNATRANPLGDGGERLHDWLFDLASFRARHGQAGGETGRADDLVRESFETVGAYVMGRRMFSNDAGPWGDDPFEGYWGADPPFRTPVFVLTHHPREPLELGETTFHFVTDGIEPALEQAETAAGDGDVRIAGGAEVARQYVDAGLVDEIRLQIVSVLLGDGVRLFEGLETGPIELERTRVVASADVTHLKYRVVR